MAVQRKLRHAGGRGVKVARRVTYPELQTLLGQHPEPLKRALGLPGARLMLPIDGRGARVLVGVAREQQDKIPREVTIDWRGQRLVIPLEKDEKYLPATIF